MIVVSPYVHVTSRGVVKNTFPNGQCVIGHVQDQIDESWTPIEVPYGSVCMLLNAATPIVLYNGLVVMVPKSCIRILEEGDVKTVL